MTVYVMYWNGGDNNPNVYISGVYTSKEKCMKECATANAIDAFESQGGRYEMDEADLIE